MGKNNCSNIKKTYILTWFSLTLDISQEKKILSILISSIWSYSICEILCNRTDFLFLATV